MTTQLDRIEAKIIKMETVLVGIEGVPDSGLVGRVAQYGKDISSLKSFRAWFFGLLGIGTVGGGGIVSWLSSAAQSNPPTH